MGDPTGLLILLLVVLFAIKRARRKTAYKRRQEGDRSGSDESLTDVGRIKHLNDSRERGG